MTRLRAPVLACVLLAALAAQPAFAIVNGRPAGPDIAPHVVMLSTARSFCSAVVIAPTLLLTAAHCVDGQGEVRVLRFGPGRTPILEAIAGIAVHPGYRADGYRKRARTIDLALITLAARLPAAFRPLPLPATGEDGIPGARYRIAGFGVTDRGDGRTGGELLEATLIGQPPVSSIQLRLAAKDGREAGACQGDSGGPVLRVTDADGSAANPALVGILTSAQGIEGTRGCGGRTGVALLKTALGWIRSQADRAGIRLAR